jgi:dTDP-4-amino-4,6-dideoxygalactose transaminase
MTDLQAAIGRQQLKRIPDMLSQRRRQVALYCRLLAPLCEIILPSQPDWARSNWQSFCIRLANKEKRDGLMKELDASGVDTRTGILCSHRQAAYSAESWRAPGKCGASEPCQALSGSENCRALSVSEDCQDTGLILPLNAFMCDEDIVRVVRLIESFLVKAAS